MPAVLWGFTEQSSRSPAGLAPDVRGLASLSLPINISAGGLHGLGEPFCLGGEQNTSSVRNPFPTGS